MPSKRLEQLFMLRNFQFFMHKTKQNKTKCNRKRRRWQLTVNNESPFILYCTIWYEWIFGATRQVFSIVIHHGNERQNAQWLIACLGKLWKWMKNDSKLERKKKKIFVADFSRSSSWNKAVITEASWSTSINREMLSDVVVDESTLNLISPTHHNFMEMSFRCRNCLLIHEFKHHQTNIIKITTNVIQSNVDTAIWISFPGA